MISLSEARSLISMHVHRMPDGSLPLEQARGYVLSEDVLADSSYPSGNRSMMDGYAIRGDAIAGKFRVIESIAASDVPSTSLSHGEAVRVSTGALLPEGSGRVVMQEHVQREGDALSIEQFEEELNIRREGSEAKRGDLVLAAGSKLGPAELAVLAQVGVTVPRVVKRPCVRHIATGNEIVSPEFIPALGQIRDSNSTLLNGLLGEFGLNIGHSHHQRDNLDQLTRSADVPCDLLLISGGASVGDHDHGAEALRRVGFTIHFNKVNLRPGKPLTFATRGRQVAFVIPGNPVSHFVTWHVAIRAAAELLIGRVPEWNLAQAELVGGEMLKANARETFWPARAKFKDARLLVAPQIWSSGNAFALTDVNALVRVASGALPGKMAETLLLGVP
jgi:molybdopterin molybdotransferase